MEQMRLRTHLEVKEDRLLVRPEGRLDEATRAIFQQVLGAAMNVERRVRVDLSRVTYLDRHGVQALLDTASRYPQQQLELSGDSVLVGQLLSLLPAGEASWLRLPDSARMAEPKTGSRELTSLAAAA